LPCRSFYPAWGTCCLRQVWDRFKGLCRPGGCSLSGLKTVYVEGV
jgi:hypothetical protein